MKRLRQREAREARAAAGEAASQELRRDYHQQLENDNTMEELRYHNRTVRDKQQVLALNEHLQKEIQ